MKKTIFIVLLVIGFSRVFAQPVPIAPPEIAETLARTEIIIGNWYENYDTNSFVPRSYDEEVVLEYRRLLQERNNFRMRERNIASWTEIRSLAEASIMTGNPAASVFLLQENWAMSLIAQNIVLVYPINNNRVIDLRNPQPLAAKLAPPFININAVNAFTFDGKTYAFSPNINMNNAQVVFFNKRLFREAGLDPDLPYNMQRDGTWTWENFLRICRQLTRDTNNDGRIDTYALPRDLSSDILDAFVASNGANYIDRDPRTGRFVNATDRPEFLEALQFVLKLYSEGLMKPRPEETSWDWYKAEFADGNVAMRIDESYVWNELRNMRDDWGVVLPPRGPRSNTYRVYTRENVMVIPATFTQAQVDAILWAVCAWHTPQTNDWKSIWYQTFRDSRAVDETLELIRNTDLHMQKNYVFIPGLNRGDIAWNMWHHDGDPAQLIESVSENWNSKIQDVNYNLFD